MVSGHDLSAGSLLVSAAARPAGAAASERCKLYGKRCERREVAVIGETLKHATIIVATVPILLVYPFLQKYFVKGALIGAIKG